MIIVIMIIIATATFTNVKISCVYHLQERIRGKMND